MNFIGQRVLKTALGAPIAMAISDMLGLKYGLAAGIIVILSIQNTKKESFTVALKRFVSTIIALGISSILFKIFSFSPWVFGVFLMLFIPIAVKVKVGDGIVVSSVLVTHLMSEKSVNMSILGNEVMLFLIGAIIALILNLYMPSVENEINEEQRYIEELIKYILIEMSISLTQRSVSIKEELRFNELEETLNRGKKRAIINYNNYFFINSNYYNSYMDMRINQLEILKSMRGYFQRLSEIYHQNYMLSEFINDIGESIHEKNNAETLLKELNLLKEKFRIMDLPKTREEFENRSLLFQFLNDMEQFLKVKNNFAKDRGMYV
ncbi:aromatic acid exporter family protein [Clostridium frigidicarnis]|uniref:aromatic acid exporter family protein n=1 Tax=Clostridium frigidicarnis TaxID=84698 RepID=UPI000B7ED24D|nr:aromatic acid exporter family protein [Clostridium frigidicarnis]